MPDRSTHHTGKRARPTTMPSEVTGKLSFFDRFATATATFASHAGFFAFCVLLVVLWVPSFLILPSIDTWQLVINTATTIITFLMVALLQNTQARTDRATQQKLNAIADGLAEMMGELSDNYPELQRHRTELRDAVGLENREGSD
ncbi:low affinity iron permease family protein [Nocardia sp. NBC_01503]|uniref:low affinity iron permease family protein n=1 Tax=Nocardia sp. NBC_01503 TaxID=2975997 RepID=UPI002E7B5248|nr:low affinity iron permease family protein [Nocardia sp. NBC_01503]WTL30587.1 low affinity iron permease family protein [Nocardia sp. NBC_01503]